MRNLKKVNTVKENLLNICGKNILLLETLDNINMIHINEDEILINMIEEEVLINPSSEELSQLEIDWDWDTCNIIHLHIINNNKIDGIILKNTALNLITTIELENC